MPPPPRRVRPLSRSSSPAADNVEAARRHISATRRVAAVFVVLMDVDLFTPVGLGMRFEVSLRWGVDIVGRGDQGARPEAAHAAMTCSAVVVLHRALGFGGGSERLGETSRRCGMRETIARPEAAHGGGAQRRHFFGFGWTILAAARSAAIFSGGTGLGDDAGSRDAATRGARETRARPEAALWGRRAAPPFSSTRVEGSHGRWEVAVPRPEGATARPEAALGAALILLSLSPVSRTDAVVGLANDEHMYRRPASEALAIIVRVGDEYMYRRPASKIAVRRATLDPSPSSYVIRAPLEFYEGVRGLFQHALHLPPAPPSEEATYRRPASRARAPHVHLVATSPCVVGILKTLHGAGHWLGTLGVTLGGIEADVRLTSGTGRGRVEGLLFKFWAR
ncbi:hypothetical protein BD626DRAFT_591853 [Schizophyllum amplum]|uniref:Uncharacterized protein n=1 Tax=Schizophyllum amplum TaxID=97359 RepID=A0A550D0J2_9AGAR|nr:hypothetical protein BD626DRAFT_591853 [Auriculariopsis ampla]